MAVNSFVRDVGDSDPMVRALALRTMGCIAVQKISEYLARTRHPFHLSLFLTASRVVLPKFNVLVLALLC